VGFDVSLSGSADSPEARTVEPTHRGHRPLHPLYFIEMKTAIVLTQCSDRF